MNDSQELLKSAKKVYEERIICVNGREYGLNKMNFKFVTKMAAFAEKMEGLSCFGSDQFHDAIKPILLDHITFKTMLISKQESLIDSDEFIKDSLKLLSTAIVAFSYPLLAGGS